MDSDRSRQGHRRLSQWDAGNCLVGFQVPSAALAATSYKRSGLSLPIIAQYRGDLAYSLRTWSATTIASSALRTRGEAKRSRPPRLAEQVSVRRPCSRLEQSRRHHRRCIAERRATRSLPRDSDWACTYSRRRGTAHRRVRSPEPMIRPRSITLARVHVRQNCGESHTRSEISRFDLRVAHRSSP